jgi:hypothetical protein
MVRMRPFGHFTARAEREPIIILESAIDKAWKAFLLEPGEYHDKVNRPSSYDDRFTKTHFDRAERMHRECKTTIAQLHGFILATDYTCYRTSQQLGLFVSGGYQALPDAAIVYDLSTPELHYIGAHLERKQLVIDGAVGESPGMHMIGDLIVNGSAGSTAGLCMIGHLVNNGTLGGIPGFGMFGTLTNNGMIMKDYYPDAIMPADATGKIGDEWQMASHLFPSYQRWKFLRAIKNPGGLSFGKLHDALSAEYSLKWMVGR